MHTDLAKKISALFRRQTDHFYKWFLLTLVVIVFALLIYPSLISHRHAYQLGDIADHDTKAPRDFFVEDPVATETNRQLAVEQVLTVYDHDPRIAQQISERVRKSFSFMRDKLAQIDAPEKDGAADGAPVSDISSTPLPTLDPQAREKAVAVFRNEFAETLGLTVERGAFRLLTAETFSSRIAELIVRILTDIMANGVVANKEVLLKEADKGIILRNVASQTEKTVFALRQYYGPDQAKTMVRIVAEPLVKDLNYNAINLIVDYCQLLIQPNITLNRNETEKRKAQALENIKPIMYRIKAGEMIMREGERISAMHMLKLDEMNRQTDSRPFSTAGLGAAVMVATLLVTSYLLYFSGPRYGRRSSHKNLTFLSVSLVAVFIMVKIAAGIDASLPPGDSMSLASQGIVYAIPIAAAPMLICLLMGFEIALLFSLVSTLSAALLFGGRLELLFFFIINQTLAAYWVQNCRERKIMVIAGLKLGLLNIFLILIAGIYTAENIGFQLFWYTVFGFLGGLGSSIITVGLAPLVEMAFGYTTDITLLELANLDRPILRRLMIEAPGTYHHSMVVGSMVEAAASDIGANPLLAKVSAYYHDIGKVKKPPYFIENQTSRNKHDKLAPSMSSLILIAHIKDGVEIAQKNKLGQPIIDTIQQHHGTSLISYFFEKAKQLKGEDAVKIEDFRYPGPKPQTKETGLVMLADVVEAASRTLENPTPARIQGLVQHLINKVFSDGQLDNCELTLKDLHSIAKSFNKILYGIHHHRIEYNETAGKEVKEGNKLKDGHSDRQPTGKAPYRDPKNPKESAGHLKRLGLS